MYDREKKGKFIPLRTSSCQCFDAFFPRDCDHQGSNQGDKPFSFHPVKIRYFSRLRFADCETKNSKSSAELNNCVLNPLQSDLRAWPINL